MKMLKNIANDCNYVVLMYELYYITVYTVCICMTIWILVVRHSEFNWEYFLNEYFFIDLVIEFVIVFELR